MFIDQKHSTLENGIEVVTDRAPHFQAVSIAVSFRIGSVHEPDEKSGISHLLEHLVFRGTKNRTGEEIQAAFAAFAAFGGYLNAETDEDSTTYVGNTLVADLKEALAILADIVTHPLLNDDDIVMEKQIIEQENCRGCYNCSMRDAFYDQAFPNQSLRNPVIGYEDTVEALTRDDLLEYHRLAYVGKNLTVAISGDIEHEDVVAYVNETFCELPTGTAAGYPELQYNPGEMLLGSSSDRSSLRFGFPLTGFDTKQRRAAVFYYEILGGHGQSKLMQELREKRGLVYNVWADEYVTAGQRMLFIEVSGEAKKMPEICTILIDTMIDTATNLDENDLNLVKKRMHAGVHMALDDISSRCKAIQSDVAVKGHLVDWKESYEEYQNLTLEDVEKAGQAILALEPTIIASGSVRGMPKFEHLRAKLKGQDVKQESNKRGLFGLRS